MPKFRFLSDITAADVAFEAFGKTEREMLEHAALGLEEAIVDTQTLRKRTKENLNIRGVSLEDVLFSLLDHLLFLKGAKQLVFKDIKIGVERQGKSWVLQGFAYGEKLDPNRHKLKTDVSAVSKRLFELHKTQKGYRAQVLLEV